MATNNLGQDIYWLGDFAPTMHTVEGRAALSQALYRRLATLKGSMWYDPEYGEDITRYISAATRPQIAAGMVAQAINNECVADERVDSAAATVQYYEQQSDDGEHQAGTVTIDIVIDDGDGPFALSDLAGDIIEVL